MTFRTVFRAVSWIFLDKPEAKLANATYKSLEIKIVGEGAEDKKIILDYFPPEKFSILLNKTELALDNKWLFSIIEVRAIDNVGLERGEALVPERLIKFYVVSASALLILLISFLVIKVKRKLTTTIPNV